MLIISSLFLSCSSNLLISGVLVAIFVVLSASVLFSKLPAFQLSRTLNIYVCSVLTPRHQLCVPITSAFRVPHLCFLLRIRHLAITSSLTDLFLRLLHYFGVHLLYIIFGCPPPPLKGPILFSLEDITHHVDAALFP